MTTRASNDIIGQIKYKDVRPLNEHIYEANEVLNSSFPVSRVEVVRASLISSIAYIPRLDATTKLEYIEVLKNLKIHLRPVLKESYEDIGSYFNAFPLKIAAALDRIKDTPEWNVSFLFRPFPAIACKQLDIHKKISLFRQICAYARYYAENTDHSTALISKIFNYVIHRCPKSTLEDWSTDRSTALRTLENSIMKPHESFEKLALKFITPKEKYSGLLESIARCAKSNKKPPVDKLLEMYPQDLHEAKRALLNFIQTEDFRARSTLLKSLIELEESYSLRDRSSDIKYHVRGLDDKYSIGSYGKRMLNQEGLKFVLKHHPQQSLFENCNVIDFEDFSHVIEGIKLQKQFPKVLFVFQDQHASTLYISKDEHENCTAILLDCISDEDSCVPIMNALPKTWDVITLPIDDYLSVRQTDSSSSIFALHDATLLLTNSDMVKNIIDKREISDQERCYFISLKNIPIEIYLSTQSQESIKKFSDLRTEEEQIRVHQALTLKSSFDVDDTCRLCESILVDHALEIYEKVPKCERIFKLHQEALQSYVSSSQNHVSLHPEITTLKVTKQTNIRKIMRIVKQMILDVDYKLTLAESLSNMEDLTKRLKGSFQRFKAIFEDLKSGKNSIYIAIDQQHNLEAIASVKSCEGCKIESLVTHHKNIFPLGLEGEIRGAGRSVVTHIAQDALLGQNNSNEEVELVSLKTARSFYTQLGFEEVPCEDSDYDSDSDERNRMVLTKENIKKLIHARPKSHAICMDEILLN